MAVRPALVRHYAAHYGELARKLDWLQAGTAFTLDAVSSAWPS